MILKLKTFKIGKNMLVNLYEEHFPRMEKEFNHRGESFSSDDSGGVNYYPMVIYLKNHI